MAIVAPVFQPILTDVPISPITVADEPSIENDDAFDPVFYGRFYVDMDGREETELYAHWNGHGQTEGRFPNFAAFLDNRASNGCVLPREFSVEAYKSLNPGLAGLFSYDWELIVHYLDSGAAEGRLYKIEDVGVLVEQPGSAFLDGEDDPIKNDFVSAPTPITKPSQVAPGFVEEDIDIIAKSGLFDAGWYAETYPDVAHNNNALIEDYVRYGAEAGRNPCAIFNTRSYECLFAKRLKTGRNPFADYILNGRPDHTIDAGYLSNFSRESVGRGIKRLQNFPLFAADDYTSLNSDIVAGNANPSNHAMAYGFSEGRRVFRKDRIANVLGSVSKSGIVATDISETSTAGIDDVGVYYNAEGNGFIRHLAAELVEAIVKAGGNAILRDEQSSMVSRPPICIFVAPHEFFHVGRGREWATEEIVSNGIMYNTEQPQTIWFERAIPFLLMSKGVIDLCYQVFRLFAESGLPAIHFNPHIVMSKTPWLTDKDSEHPLVRVLPKQAKSSGNATTPLQNRPIDIAFFGNSSSHRDHFFSRAASFLAGYECYLYYRRFSSPLTASHRDEILTRLAGHVGTWSKIVLNIHRDDYGFFEWHRIVQLGLACGSTVVSEPCLPHPIFKPNIHYFEEAGRHIPNLIDWLLQSSDGRIRAEEARLEVASVVEDTTKFQQNSSALMRFLGQKYHFNAA